MSFLSGTDWLLAQVKTFVAALCGGALLGLLWRLYAALYRPKSRRRRDWLLPDLVFALAAWVMLAAYWFAFTDGGLRAQDFLWLALGALLFRLLPPLKLPRLKSRGEKAGQKKSGRPAASHSPAQPQSHSPAQHQPKSPAQPRPRQRKQRGKGPDPALRLFARWSALLQDRLAQARARLRRHTLEEGRSDDMEQAPDSEKI